MTGSIRLLCRYFCRHDFIPPPQVNTLASRIVRTFTAGRLPALASGVFLIGLLCGKANAATYTWSGGDPGSSDWLLADNWVGNSSPAVTLLRRTGDMMPFTEMHKSFKCFTAAGHVQLSRPGRTAGFQ